MKPPITTEKVAGVEPLLWASFRGYSLLFDNPGKSLAATPGRLNLSCDVDGDPQLGFYRALKEGIGKDETKMLVEKFMYCPLPTFSYHVTAWDGGNDYNLRAVGEACRHQLQSLFTGLPDSLGESYLLTDMILSSPLVTQKNWSLHFKFRNLIKWDDGLGAELVPDGKESGEALKIFAEERSQFIKRYRQNFGIGLTEEYRPHVSLGYFANAQVATEMASLMESWDKRMKQQMDGFTLSFNTISLYGFTDMATFFKTG